PGPLALPSSDPATRGVVSVLWLAHWEPNRTRATAWLAAEAGVEGYAAVAASGLLAARDGWSDPPPGPVLDDDMRQRCDDLAARLAGPTRFGSAS
ncbi:MAG: hypothetical protein SGI84_02340, partial [Gemmatimonadota bacterium]|nr:hypothetical protein [Gemmatimonadota bacterium]